MKLFPDPLQTSLSSAPQVSTSDHKPVIGAFSVRESPPVATLDADAATRSPLIRVCKLRAKGLRGESGVLGQHATPSHPIQPPPARAPFNRQQQQHRLDIRFLRAVLRLLHFSPGPSIRGRSPREAAYRAREGDAQPVLG